MTLPTAELSEGHIYLKFFVLTALNPFTIVYFTALIAGNGSQWDYTWQDMVFFVIGAGLASLSWQILLVYLGCYRQALLLPPVPGGDDSPGQSRGDRLGRSGAAVVTKETPTIGPQSPSGTSWSASLQARRSEPATVRSMAWKWEEFSSFALLPFQPLPPRSSSGSTWAPTSSTSRAAT